MEFYVMWNFETKKQSKDHEYCHYQDGVGDRICVAEFFIFSKMTFCNVITGSCNGEDFGIHRVVTLVGCKVLDQLVIEVFLLAHFIIFILIVWTVRMSVTLEAWVYAGVGSSAEKVVLISAGDAVEARRCT